MTDSFDFTSLPNPTVKYVLNPNFVDEAATQGIMSNPVYTGIPPYPRAISDETWIRAAAELIKQEGPEQFLVNMLYMLRSSMVSVVPQEAIPDDYDGPWPNDDDDGLFVTDDDRPSPWHYPLEGFIYCSHDDLPMILINDEFVCIAEYLYAHIDNASVNDLVTEPILSLVFQNGHTLPLICPDCGESLHVTDQSELLDEINGLTLINVDWDDDVEELMLEFGPPGSHADDIDDTPYLIVHLDSVRGLTCPYQNLWDNRDLDEAGSL